MARKRARNGEGAVYFHKATGRWCAKIPALDAAGNRKYVTQYCNRSENSEAAAAKLLLTMRIEAEQFAGRLQRTEKSSLHAFLEEWMTFKQHDLRASTINEYKRFIGHVEKHGAKLRMGTLNGKELDLMYVAMRRGGVKPADLHKTHKLIKAALKTAIKWKRINSNVADDVVAPPQYEPGRQTPFTDEETTKLIASCDRDSMLYLFILMAMDGGMRLGELFALRWENVDEAAGTINVMESITEVNGRQILGPPKSEAGYRKVDMSETTRAAIKPHKAILLKKGRRASPYVFPNENGKAMYKRSFYRDLWTPLLCKLYGSHEDPQGPYKNGRKRPPVPNKRVRFHTVTRHTSTTRQLERGIEPHVVAERNGHSVAVMMKTYAHVTAKQRKKAASTLDDLLAENA